MNRHLINDCQAALDKCKVLTSTYHMPAYTTPHLKADAEDHVRRCITRQIADLLMKETELQVNETPPNIINDPEASTEYRMTMVVLTEADYVELRWRLRMLATEEEAVDRIIARMELES